MSFPSVDQMQMLQIDCPLFVQQFSELDSFCYSDGNKQGAPNTVHTVSRSNAKYAVSICLHVVTEPFFMSNVSCISNLSEAVYPAPTNKIVPTSAVIYSCSCINMLSVLLANFSTRSFKLFFYYPR